ncbi:MAG: autotransporter domain-containing protein, partial [Deltaproteobacteria bacterium]|nr:autotransporter domain-containing protein [Deltaproteobacteria bacterium]
APASNPYDAPYINSVLGIASNNVFYNIDVAVGTRQSGSATGGVIQGGGIIGVRTYTKNAVIDHVENNVFRNINITTRAGSLFTGELVGGGVIGATSKGYSSINYVVNNTFNAINVNINGDVSGGGIIGVESSEPPTNPGEPAATIGAITGNAFRNISVNITSNGLADSGTLRGGGIVGIYTPNGLSAVFSLDADYDLQAINNNRFSNINVNAAGPIYGSGIIGLNNRDLSLIGPITNNIFSNMNIRGKLIEGGGVIGIYSDSLGVLWGVENSFFQNTTVISDYYIDGGGIIGVTGDSASTNLVAGILFIKNSYFANNRIVANNGIIMGGLVYTYGTTGADYLIEDSIFINNEFVSAINPASYNQGNSSLLDPQNYGTFGTVVVDTGRAANDPNVSASVTLSATSDSSLIFYNNVIKKAGRADRYNSLYFGEIPEYDYDEPAHTFSAYSDPTAIDASLTIKAQDSGTVALYDPIEVYQTGQYAFTMTAEGTGDFVWAGENNFNVAAANSKNVITLKAGLTTTLSNNFGSDYYKPFSLNAPNHDFILENGSHLNILGQNHMTLNSAKLHGTLFFSLATSKVNDPGTSVITIQTAANNHVDLSDSYVILSDVRAGKLLSAGDRFFLIDSLRDSNIAGSPSNNIATARQGYFYKYNLIVDKQSGGGYTDRHLVARMAHPDDPLLGGLPPSEVVPEVKLLSEGQIASLSLASQNTGWLADNSYRQADLALERSNSSWAPFGGFDGTWLHTEGSKISLEAIRVMAGLAYRKVFDRSKLVLGSFIEAGVGKYRIEADYGTLFGKDIRAKGEVKTISLGLMSRYRLDNGFSLEAGGRVGSVHNEFQSNAFDTYYGHSLKYDLNLPFYSAYGAIGYDWQINENSSLEFFGRYYWTSQDGKTVTLDQGETVTFDKVSSSTTQTGVRYSRGRNEKFTYYVGAHWEHGFDIDAVTSVYGENFKAAKPSGDTIVGEVGMIYNVNENNPWGIECGFQGFAGQNRGISGGLRLRYEF